MAELSESGGRLKGNPRIDLTPMVDLGFLLITFFIFTTTLIDPRIMEISMPVDGEPAPVAEHRALTIYLGKDHNAYVLAGETKDLAQLKKCRLDAKGIRSVLMQHKLEAKGKSIALKRSGNEEPVILIKAGRESCYNDLINILDEMSITGCNTYALLDTDVEEEWVLAKIP